MEKQVAVIHLDPSESNWFEVEEFLTRPNQKYSVWFNGDFVEVYLR